VIREFTKILLIT